MDCVFQEWEGSSSSEDEDEEEEEEEEDEEGAVGGEEDMDIGEDDGNNIHDLFMIDMQI